MISMDKFNVLSINAGGLGNYWKRRMFFAKIRDMNADIVCVQETHSDAKCERVWQHEWGGKILFAHGTTNARGVAIMFRPKVTIDMLSYEAHPFGRFLVVKLKIWDTDVVIGNVYGPNVDDVECFKEFFETTDQMEVVERIIVGDFNVVYNCELDRTDNKRYNVKCHEEIVKYVEAHKLIDPWRVKNPATIEYTWCRMSPTYTGSRLDYALISDTLLNKVLRVYHEVMVGTDHKALMINFNKTCHPRGPGFWKFNNVLLENSEFTERVGNYITDCLNRYRECESAATKWELVKVEVCSMIKILAAELARNKRQKIDNAQLQHAAILTALQSNPSDAILKQLYVESKQVLDEFWLEKARAAAFRAKANWVECGERSSKYFFALEKSNYISDK